MASTVANLLGGGLLTGVSKVIDSIRGKSPEDAAKLAQTAADLQALQEKYASDFALAKINENVQLNAIAGENVRADAQSGDKFTVRARPAVIWGGLLIMSWNYMLIPVMGIRWHIAPVAFPDMFWEIWGIVATGVVFARSLDKGVASLLGGAGGSMQLPLGIKLDSKGN